MYNELACCAPIHDAETQWAYETLVNVADRCGPANAPRAPLLLRVLGRLGR
jgi:hypothetical protein